METWRDVPAIVADLIKEGSSVFNRLRVARKQLPFADCHGIWFNPRNQTVYFTLGDGDSEDVVADWMDGLQVKGVRKVMYTSAETPPPKDKGPWIRVKEAEVSSVVKPLAWAGGWTPGGTAELFGGPNPLAATIATGALGAGAGYLTGTLVEQLFPKWFAEKGKLRNTLGIAGGALGAAPGIWHGTINHRNHGWGGWMKPFGATPPPAAPDPHMKEWDYQDKTGAMIQSINSFLDILTEAAPIQKREAEKLANAFFDNGYYSAPAATGGYGGGASGGQGAYVKGIDKDRFNRAVWDDPYLPDAYKGMTSGVMEGAAQVSDSDGYSSSLVSPMDIARVGIGMGSGWASGLLVGKTLGALAGVTPQTQKALQAAGVFAGLIRGTVPRLFN